MSIMKNILWVEDEVDTYRSFSLSFDKNLNVTRAVDYQDACKKYNSSHFDLIVVDIIIPSGNVYTNQNDLMKDINIYYGIEFIKYVKSNDNEAKIIVLSVVSDSATFEIIKNIDKNIEVLWKYDVTFDDFNEAIIDKLK
jgi:CheY-like chemotaxis protein